MKLQKEEFVFLKGLISYVHAKIKLFKRISVINYFHLLIINKLNRYILRQKF